MRAGSASRARRKRASGGSRAGVLLSCGLLITGVPLVAAARSPDDQPRPLTAPPAGKIDGVSAAIGWSKGFVLGFERFDTRTLANSVLVQRFDASGTPSGGALTLQKPMPVGVGQPEFADLGDDRFGIVWRQGGALKSSVFDAAKRTLGKASSVVASSAIGYGHPIARLSRGDVALVTHDAPKAGVENVTLAILDDRMRLKIKPVVLEKGTSNAFGVETLAVAVVAHGDGGVAAYLGQGGQIAGAPFDEKGKPGKRFKVNTTPLRALDGPQTQNFRIKAAPLNGGGYAVVWTSTDPTITSVTHLRGRAYDKKGDPVGKSDFSVSLDAFAIQLSPEVLPTKSGFAVAWTQKGAFNELPQEIRYFDEDGRPLSDALVTEYYGADGRGMQLPLSEIAYAALPDGSFANVFGADGEHGLFVDGVSGPTFGSDAKADRLKGDKTAETLLGEGKDDQVDGDSGNDAIDGGPGVDTIDGGPGDDFIAGGPDADELTGGTGADVFLARPGGGNDVIQDFEISVDRVDVSAFHYPSKPAVLAHAARQGEDVVLTLTDQQAPAGAGSTVVRLRKLTTDLTTANVIF